MEVPDFAVRRSTVHLPAWSQRPSQGMPAGKAKVDLPSAVVEEGTPPWVATVQPSGRVARTAKVAMEPSRGTQAVDSERKVPSGEMVPREWSPTTKARSSAFSTFSRMVPPQATRTAAGALPGITGTR